MRTGMRVFALGLSLAIGTGCGQTDDRKTQTVVQSAASATGLAVPTAAQPAIAKNHKPTPIIIEGDNFTGVTVAANVRLGAKALVETVANTAPVVDTAATPHKITGLSIPAGLTAGIYVLTIDNGKGFGNVGIAVEIADGTPTVTAVSPATIALGTATAVTITGTNLDAAATAVAAELVPQAGGANVALTAVGLPVAAATSLTGFTVPATVGRGVYDLVVKFTIGTLILQSATSSADRVQVREGEHLLITEVSNQGETDEFIEIYNPTGETIALDGYYLTDAIDNDTAPVAPAVTNHKIYWKIADPASRNNASSGANNDFHIGFPSGATLAGGVFAVISLQDHVSTFGTFFQKLGRDPDYEMSQDNDVIPNMVAAPGQGWPTGADRLDHTAAVNKGEAVVLYYWDGSATLVKDVDYFLYADGTEVAEVAAYKNNPPQDQVVGVFDPRFSGLAVYHGDTDSNTQKARSFDNGGVEEIRFRSGVNGSGHDRSFQRRRLSEAGERTTGGNGLGGHDETSEQFVIAFSSDAIASPGRQSMFSPFPGQTGVATNTTVTAFLPRVAVNPVSVDANNFKLTDLTTGTAVAAAAAGGVSFANKTATFQPAAALSANHVFRATITVGVTLLAGGAYLNADFSWDFFTGTVRTTASANDVVINEMLCNANGDPNRDNNTAATNEQRDEFVELVNNTDQFIDLAGWSIFNTGSTTVPVEIFAPGTILPPRGVVTVFGGGDFGGAVLTSANRKDYAKNPGLSGALFVNAGKEFAGSARSGQAFMANTGGTSGLGLSNAATGEDLRLVARSGVEVDRFTDPAVAVQGVSSNRGGDGLAGATMRRHNTVVGARNTGTAGQDWSAGKRVEQGDFRRLLINEVLTQPDGVAQDTNGDGQFSATQDEFIEIVNLTTSDLDLKDFTLLEGAVVIHTFSTLTLPRLGSVVVFGGGAVTNYPAAGKSGHGLLASAWPAAGLGNANGTITLRDAGSDPLDSFAYAAATAGVSFNRNSDGLSAGAVGLHTAVQGNLFYVTNAGTATAFNFSPGRRVDQNGFPFVMINEALLQPGAADDVNGDGTATPAADEFIEILNRTGWPVDLGGYTLIDGTGALLFTIPVAAGATPTVTLPPYGALVIFSGGTPRNYPPAQQAAALQTSGAALAVGGTTGGLSLPDPAGLTVAFKSLVLRDADTKIVSFMQFNNATGANPPVAVVPVQGTSCNLPADGLNFEFATAANRIKLHTAINAAANFSPGKRTDQTPYP